MRTFLYGVIFGVFATFIGLFVGLQVSSIVGTILLFPVMIVFMITDTPLGMMSGNLRMISILVACVTWGLVFVLVKYLWWKYTERRRF